MLRQPVLWCVCALLLLGAAQTGLAGVLDETTGTIRPTIAVLEFHDYSGYRGRMLGRRAALQLHRALTATGRWSLVEPGEVSAAVAELDLRPPFAVGYQQALAHRLNADLTVTGRIEGAPTGGPNSRVSLALTVDFVERIAGQSVMPMNVTGVAPATETPTPTDVRVDAALADACARIAAAAGGEAHAHATVVGVRGKDISLDSGAGTPLLTDDMVLVYRVRSGVERSAEAMGVALVKSVDGQKASAVLLGKERDVYTDDRAVRVGPVRDAAGR